MGSDFPVSVACFFHIQHKHDPLKPVFFLLLPISLRFYIHIKQLYTCLYEMIFVPPVVFLWCWHWGDVNIYIANPLDVFVVWTSWSFFGTQQKKSRGVADAGSFPPTFLEGPAEQWRTPGWFGLYRGWWTHAWSTYPHEKWSLNFRPYWGNNYG